MADTLPAARSVWLVAAREFNSRARSRRVVVGTVSVALLLIGFLLVQMTSVHQQPPLRIGLAGQAIGLQQGLPQEMTALGVPITVRQLDSVADGVRQVRTGKLDVLVYGARSALHVTVADGLDPRLRATLNSQVRQQILEAQIAQLGARPDEVLAKVDQAQITVTQLGIPRADVGGGTTLGVLTVLLLGWSLFAFARLTARRTAQDTATGTAEALLTVLRPRRLLTGNLGGIGLTGLVHAAALGVVGLVTALATGATSGAPLSVALGTGLVGFVLGYGMYGTATAAVTALGRRGVAALIAVAGVVGAVLIGVAPGSAATGVLSVLPPFAPLLLPARLALGVASGWQVLVGVVLTLLTIAGLAWFAGRVYPRSLLQA
jgi:ABC-2 type transport system permease protein